MLKMIACKNENKIQKRERKKWKHQYKKKKKMVNEGKKKERKHILRKTDLGMNQKREKNYRFIA